MKSSYKCIGDLVERVDIRNTDGTVSKLVGLSIDKCFILSVANTVGTDLSKYKVIQKDDFAVSLMQVSRDEKIPVARFEDEKAIMSPAYSIFRVKNRDEVMSEYLELWFKRSEFDREASFIAVGGVRGSMPWSEFAGMKVAVPPLERQLEIVKTYASVADRISLKRKIDALLFEQGKIIFKDLYEQGRCFGESMTLYDFCSDIVSGGTPDRAVDCFWNSQDIAWLKNGEIKNNIILSTEEYISTAGLKGSSAKMVSTYTVNMAMYCVSEIQVSFSCIPLSSNQAVLNLSTDSFRKSCLLYYLLATLGNDITSQANGSAQQNLSKEKIATFNFKCPNLNERNFDYFEKNMQERILIAKEISQLLKMQEIILSELSHV